MAPNKCSMTSRSTHALPLFELISLIFHASTQEKPQEFVKVLASTANFLSTHELRVIWVASLCWLSRGSLKSVLLHCVTGALDVSRTPLFVYSI